MAHEGEKGLAFRPLVGCAMGCSGVGKAKG